jgi:hypothetical protein
MTLATARGAAAIPPGRVAYAWREGAASAAPILRWTFDKGDARDTVAGVRGTPMGWVRFDEGLVGKGAALKGRGARIVMRDPRLNMDEWRQVTISAWVRAGSYRTLGTVLGRGVGASDCGCLLSVGGGDEHDTPGVFAVHLQGGQRGVVASRTFRAGAKAAPRTDAWYHVVGTYDGLHLRYYVNGQLDSQAAAPPGRLRVADNAEAETVFGNAPGGRKGPAAGLQGKIDELKIWKRALSPDEVGALYRALRSQAQRQTGNIPDP